MSEIEQFTREASAMLQHYLQRYKESLNRSGMTPDEIKDVIEEVRQHIIDHCGLKAGEDSVITTDQVKSAIQKLGEPEIVEKVLREELETFEQVKRNPQQIIVTAEHAVKIFKGISVISSIFALSSLLLNFLSYSPYMIYQAHVILLMLSLGWYLLIHRRPEFHGNAYLERFIKLNVNHLLIPQITLILYLTTSSLRPDFFVLMSTFLSVSLLFSREAQQFYKGLIGR